MIEIEIKKFIFRTKVIWFSDYPFEVNGFDRVIFSSCKNKVDIEGFSCQEFPTLIIDLTEDLEDIWKKFDKKSCRYLINRAVKENINIEINQNYNKFYKLNDSFRKNKKLTSSENIAIYENYGTLFTVKIKEDIIAGHLYLQDENNMRWLLGASKRLESDKQMSILIGCGNRLIIWKAIEYAKNMGIQEFDLGGYYTGKWNEQLEGINTFKKSFGGKLVTRYNYQKDYSKSYKILSKIKQNYFYNLYKSGNFNLQVDNKC